MISNKIKIFVTIISLSISYTLHAGCITYGDGILDIFDNDCDNDGIINSFDDDADNDGIIDAFDNDMW
tara:strand:+ start:203 stop:406 length:204 start_codon:yes stop_codon:yes gene_type:complete